MTTPTNYDQTNEWLNTLDKKVKDLVALLDSGLELGTTIDDIKNRLNEIMLAGGRVFESEFAGRQAVEVGQYFYVAAPSYDVSKQLRKKTASNRSELVANEPSSTDDVANGWQAAIQGETEFRMPDSPISYSHSFADGGPENREPLKYADRQVGYTGLNYQFAAPNAVVWRSMINIPANEGRVWSVDILTGVPPGDQSSVGSGIARSGVAWYSASRVRLSNTPSTLFEEGQGGTKSSSYRINFTVGDSSECDIQPPSGAVYAMPFFEYTGQGYNFYAAQFTVRDRTLEFQQLRAKHQNILSLVTDGVGSTIFDFSDPLSMDGAPKLGQTYPSVRSISDSAVFSGSAVGIYTTSGIKPGQDVETQGALTFNSNKPLLPRTGDFTMFFSMEMDIRSTGSRTAVWQHQAGVTGRTQMSLNSRFTGSVQAPNDETFQLWMNGITDGLGAGGYPKPANAQRGYPCCVVAVIRGGRNQSQLWVNGELVDTFTRPSSIAQVNTSLMGTAGTEANQPGVTKGRFGVINKALNEQEVRIAGEWIAEAYGKKWGNDFLGSSDLLASLGAVSYSISSSEKPSFINDYSNVQPLFLRGQKQRLYPASMAKVLTTMVLLDNINDLNEVFTVIDSDATGGSGNNLNANDQISIEDAIYNMLLPSSNVTTTVVARNIGLKLLGQTAGDPVNRFVEEMNKKAKSLGMTDSNFTNASGLANEDMVTTADDMAALCMHVPSYPEIFDRWGTVSHTINIDGPNARKIDVEHSAAEVLVRNDFQGAKTGTVSGSLQGYVTRNLMWIGKAPNNRYTANVVMITTNNDRYVDARALQDYVFSSYRWPL